MSFIKAIFRDSKLSSIKKKLVLLYLLNVTDVVFTLFLIGTGMFMEINFIMAPIVYNNPSLILAMKIGIPLVLFGWIFYRMEKATSKQLFHSNIFITGGLLFYLLVNISHVLWVILYGLVEIF